MAHSWLYELLYPPFWPVIGSRDSEERCASGSLVIRRGDARYSVMAQEVEFAELVEEAALFVRGWVGDRAKR